ncbi:hypothetical protein NLI96_g11115 [Meripilus lineatus]|uniref:FUN14 family protein n=1 Tax=Meripilus lineatus TaxID=2056292 RepID=A0AAD5UTY5_9APHY|nr:hypothetical protein NLI96_g11115 [Physisporinus lineatus]
MAGMLWLPSFPHALRFRQFSSSALRNVVTQRTTNPKTLANLTSLPRFTGSGLSQLRPTTKASRAFSRTAAFTGLGLGLTLLNPTTIQCEPKPTASGTPVASRSPGEPLPPPTSIVNIYELSFGTVCGICAGVFVKKGAIALAYVFGGIFVLLQYLGSQSVIRVDWARMSSKFENLFYTTDSIGVRRPPNFGSLFRWFVDFLTANFQQRATFIAGFALGLRIG